MSELYCHVPYTTALFYLFVFINFYCAASATQSCMLLWCL